MNTQLPLYKRLNWGNSLFLIISPLIVWIFVPHHLITQGIDWKLLVLFCTFCVLTSVSITGGYHRLFAHRSYEANSLIKLLYLVFGAAALQGSALKWSTDHRRHHRYVDSDQDPYSINKGFFYAHIGWVFFKEDPQYKDQFVPDLSKDKLVAWQHKYYPIIAIAVGFLMPMGIGAMMGYAWGGLLFGGFARVVLTHHTTFLINSACHYFGTQPYGDKNTARDSFVMALFTYGEGYHNFHHRFQADFRNGVRWYQWDPTKWAIQMGSLLGLTWNLKRVSDVEILKARLIAEEKKLLQKGLPSETIQNLRVRIEEAQERFKQMKIRYNEMKSDFVTARDVKIEQMRIEMEMAKLEFRLALKQWRVCLRYA